MADKVPFDFSDVDPENKAHLRWVPLLTGDRDLFVYFSGRNSAGMSRNLRAVLDYADIPSEVSWKNISIAEQEVTPKLLQNIREWIEGEGWVVVDERGEENQ